MTASDLKSWEDYIWARPEEIFDTQDYDVFHNGATCDDIIQGSLGDCYFLSVLGSLCKYPKLIERLFHSTKKSKNHQYGVNFYINGNWKMILLDDYFPAINNNFTKFVFGYSATKELWVPLIEKAWAKINGCYARVTGGSPNEFFHICTEAPNEYVFVKKLNVTELWEKIIDGEKKNYVMTAGTTKNLNGVKLQRYGLSPGHAYTILQALEIDTGSAIEKVLKLRNPWGNFEYSGDWSDYSRKWTEELKRKYEFYKKNDGIFYMGYNDFTLFFLTVGFGKIHENYISNNIKIKKEQNIKCQLIKIKVNNNKNKKCHSFLQLYQKNPRIMLKDGTYQKEALCFLILADNNFNYLISNSSNKMHICLEYNLDTNKEYYLFTDLNYRYDSTNKGKNHGYRITSYAEEGISFENVTEDDNYDAPELLRKVVTDYAKKNLTKNNNYGATVYTNTTYSDDFPFTFAYFENESNKDQKITININYLGEKSFCYYCDDYADEDDTNIEKELPAGGNNIVMLMKYTMDSRFVLNYFFFTDYRSQEEKDKYKEKVNSKKKKKVLNDNNNTINKKESKNINKNDNKYPIDKKESKNIKENKDIKDNKNDITNINVFEEKGEPVQGNIFLVQYSKKTNDGFILGLENKSYLKREIKLNLEGLELTDEAYKGNDSPKFFIERKDKKVFNAVIKKGYKGEPSYKFEEL